MPQLNIMSLLGGGAGTAAIGTPSAGNPAGQQTVADFAPMLNQKMSAGEAVANTAAIPLPGLVAAFLQRLSIVVAEDGQQSTPENTGGQGQQNQQIHALIGRIMQLLQQQGSESYTDLSSQMDATGDIKPAAIKELADILEVSVEDVTIALSQLAQEKLALDAENAVVLPLHPDAEEHKKQKQNNTVASLSSAPGQAKAKLQESRVLAQEDEKEPEQGKSISDRDINSDQLVFNQMIASTQPIAVVESAVNTGFVFSVAGENILPPENSTNLSGNNLAAEDDSAVITIPSSAARPDIAPPIMAKNPQDSVSPETVLAAAPSLLLKEAKLAQGQKIPAENSNPEIIAYLDSAGASYLKNNIEVAPEGVTPVATDKAAALQDNHLQPVAVLPANAEENNNASLMVAKVVNPSIPQQRIIEPQTVQSQPHHSSLTPKVEVGAGQEKAQHNNGFSFAEKGYANAGLSGDSLFGMEQPNFGELPESESHIRQINDVDGLESTFQREMLPEGAGRSAERGILQRNHSQFAVIPPAEQVMVKIRNLAVNKHREIEIQLDPADLGQVNVKLDVGADGRTQVTMTVDKKETLEMLQRDRVSLEKALSELGLKTDSGSMNFNLREQPRGQQQLADQGNQQGNRQWNSETLPEELREELTPSQPYRGYTLILDEGVNIRV